MIQKMNTFQAMVLDKVNDQTKLEIKQLSIEDLPQRGSNYSSCLFECKF